MAKQKPPLLFGDWIRSECLDGDTLCEDCLADIIEMIRTAEEAALERAYKLADMAMEDAREEHSQVAEATARSIRDAIRALKE